MVRIKQRYILCELTFPDGKQKSVTERELFLLLQEKIRQLHGDYGSIVTTQSFSPLSVKYLNQDTDIVLFRTKRETAKIVLSTLPFISTSKTTSIVFKTLHVGGTIRSCKKYLITFYKKRLTEMLGTCKSEEERNGVKEAILASCQKCKRSIDLLDRVVRQRAETSKAAQQPSAT